MPWAALVGLIEPHYSKAGNGRPPRALSTMLRMYCVASWFNLADEACEDALYDIAAFRDFCNVDLGRQGVPDATTLLNFRHLLEKHNLGAAIFAKVGELLQANGLKLCGGTIVDATIQLQRRVPPRIRTTRETQRCTKPLRRGNGTLA